MAVQYGKGKVMDGYELSEVFENLNLAKDVGCFLRKHQYFGYTEICLDMDIYFISNQSDETIDLSPVFRVDKKLKPQLWDAVSGEIRDLANYEITATGIKVPLTMEAAQSWFVVFTKDDNKC